MQSFNNIFCITKTQISYEKCSPDWISIDLALDKQKLEALQWLAWPKKNISPHHNYAKMTTFKKKLVPTAAMQLCWIIPWGEMRNLSRGKKSPEKFQKKVWFFKFYILVIFQSKLHFYKRLNLASLKDHFLHFSSSQEAMNQFLISLTRNSKPRKCSSIVAASPTG